MSRNPPRQRPKPRVDERAPLTRAQGYALLESLERASSDLGAEKLLRCAYGHMADAGNADADAEDYGLGSAIPDHVSQVQQQARDVERAAQKILAMCATARRKES